MDYINRLQQLKKEEFERIELEAVNEGFTPLERTFSVNDRRKITVKSPPKVTPAVYVEKEGIVYLWKANGTIERIGTKEYWNRIKQYETEKRAKLRTERRFATPLLNCGLCKEHKNTTDLLNIVVTNRCNLRCWYCFFFAEAAGYVYEPTTEQIKKMILSARDINGYTPPIQITGGEPTIRGDLGEIIALSKSLGAPHIQLNTHSQIIGMKRFLEKYLFSTDEISEMTSEEKEWINLFKKKDGKITSVVDEIKEWRKNGLNTIYTSFDGVSPKINAYKNHYELPYALEAYEKAGIKSIVLVPTVHKGNLGEVEKIVRFAMRNQKRGIKGVNFQPISLVGMASRREREKLRVTQSDIVDEMKRFGLKMKDWFPVPAVANFADVIGKLTGRNSWVRFYNNEKCGLATYAYPYKGKLIPITEFIDVDGLLRYVYELDNNLDSFIGKLKIIGSLIPLLPKGMVYALKDRNLKSFMVPKIKQFIIINELPDGTDIEEIINDVYVKGDYSSLGRFHDKFLFFGMMHFMDPYNYDVKRVQRCSIHYASPDYRVVPFCTFNVFPEIYRDLIMKRYALKGEEAEAKKKREKKLAIKTVKFRKLFTESMRKGKEYQIYYGDLIN